MDKVTKKITTPKGRASFPHLNEPDSRFSENEFDDTYNVKLVLSAEEAQPLIEIIEGMEVDNIAYFKAENPKQKAKVKVINRPFQDETDNNGDPTGNVVFTFKMPARVKRKRDGKVFEFSPKLFDKYGRPTSEKIGGGSIIQVSAEARGYFTTMAGAGITLRLEAVMCHEFNSYGGGSADSFGFEVAAKPDGFDTQANDDDESDEDYGDDF